MKTILAFVRDDRGDIVQYLLVIALLVVFFLPDITSLQTSVGGVFSQIGTKLASL